VCARRLPAFWCAARRPLLAAGVRAALTGQALLLHLTVPRHLRVASFLASARHVGLIGAQVALYTTSRLSLTGQLAEFGLRHERGRQGAVSIQGRCASQASQDPMPGRPALPRSRPPSTPSGDKPPPKPQPRIPIHLLVAQLVAVARAGGAAAEAGVGTAFAPAGAVAAGAAGGDLVDGAAEGHVVARRDCERGGGEATGEGCEEAGRRQAAGGLQRPHTTACAPVGGGRHGGGGDSPLAWPAPSP
jgi:hypothetical protein